MLLIVVRTDGAGEPERRLRFHTSTVRIGRSMNNDIVLVGGTISRNHARISLTDAGCLVQDLDSGIGSYVNDIRIRQAALLPGDRLRIDRYTITAQQIEADGVELDLIAAIVDGRDETSRLVYADWLEANGELERAEFLRLQESLVGVKPAAPDFADRTRRLRELGQRIDLAWRYQVARPSVENCEARYSFKCPREWSSFQTTADPKVRVCDSCQEPVYYCATIADARERTKHGNCVVVDILPIRTPHDLAPPRDVESNPPPPGRLVMRPPRPNENPPMPRMPDFMQPAFVAPSPPRPKPEPEPRDDEDSIEDSSDDLVPTGEFERR